jgi:hypothetical protein
MMRGVFATCLLALVGSAAALAIVKPTQTSKQMMDDLDKMAAKTSWHKKADVAPVPAKVKEAVHSARAKRGPLVKVGGCGSKIPVKKLGLVSAGEALVVRAPEHAGRDSYSVPGAGANQKLADNGLSTHGTVNGEEPFVTVLKDGFFEVGCYHDAMLEFGDKFGDDKDKYGSVASHANVSIAKYRELVLKDEQKQMTPRICYEFCRSLPRMVFFGIHNGNECYCEPYFKPQAGDDANCDVGCQGDPTQMCGNAKGKSTIFEMHLCDDTAEDLAEHSQTAEEELTYFFETAGLAVELGKKMSEAGDALEEVGGLSGSPLSGDLGMAAKQAGGDLSKAFIAGRKDYEKLLAAANDAQGLEGGDFTSATTVRQVEHAVEAIKENDDKVHKAAQAIHKLVKASYPAVDYEVFGEDVSKDSLAKDLEGGFVANDYRLATYAMGERDLTPQGVTCSGKAVGAPMLGLGLNGCGVACENTVFPTKCVAFSHYEVEGKEDICFMFADVTDVEAFEEPASLVQKSNKDKSTKAAAVCKVKMSELSTGFKPKGELKRNKRCFGACGSFSARDSVQSFSAPSSVEVGGKEVIEKFN